jgi:hypothetical protein
MEIHALKDWIRRWIASIVDVQREWGIEANKDKSVLLVELRGKNSKKVRRQMGKEIDEIGTNGQRFKIVLQAKYLGTIIGDTGDGNNKEIQARIEKANKAMAALKDIWKQNKLDLETKVSLYKALVRTILCYSLEVRELTKTQMMRLETTQVKHLRRILRSPAHIIHETNETVRERTGTHSIDSYLLHTRLRFWKKQIEQKNIAVWIANWGNLDGLERQGTNREEEKLFVEEVLQIWEANDWGTETLTKNRRGGVVLDNVLWEALQKCNKTEVKRVLRYTSRAEKSKEKKEGPEQEATMACGKCGKKFPNKANLAHHEWAAHGKTTGIRQLVTPVTGTEEYKCFICKSIFKQKRSAQNHVQNICTRGKGVAELEEYIRQFQFSQMFSK